MAPTISEFRPARRRGFTLIEVMVVIAIIMVLVAASVAAISVIARHSKAQRTQTALESARSMWASYVATDSKQTLLKALYATAACQLDTNLVSDFGDALAPTCIKAVAGPNGEKRWPTIDSGNPDLARAIDYTEQVMRIFLTVPENRDVMNKLPAEAKYQLTDANGIAMTTVPPLLADGNGEPILFIPPAGLSNVTVSGQGSAGIIQADARWHPYPNTTADTAVNITRTPFFASAGSDRDFSKGDDNAYSVHQ